VIAMTRATLTIGLAAAGLALAAAAQAQKPTYVPQQRLRTALDTCLKTEVSRGAYCVQKCAAGFRMESAGGKPKCVGLSAGSKYEPPKPNYTPPAPGAPKPQKVPGA
jgi:uncharacterized low-complexity protein